MARVEVEREDLMREATACVRRAELEVEGETELVFAGFRRDGAWSVYFGNDPVFHFDPANRLKRAFVDGALFRSQGSTLARLVRRQTSEETKLLRTDLDEAALAEFISAATDHLKRLAAALPDAPLKRRYPADDDLRPDLQNVVTAHLALTEPLAPAFRGKR